jgi:cytochrome d ubiquinol oxidase subunit II
MPRPLFDREAIETEIDRVRSLGLDELRTLWRVTFRSSPPPAFTKDLMARFLCWHIQEQAQGGLDPETAKHLDGRARGDKRGANRPRRLKPPMMSAVAPIWDGNETWLVVTAVILWGAFPVAYAGLLPAFYLPLLVMLAGLILRGVAFEYRNKTERMRWIWDLSFTGGSLAAAFIQGLTVGALVEGLPWANGHYAGGDFGWLTPYAALCGIGLCLGYALLGASWLVKKCEGDVREAAYRHISYLSAGLLIFLIAVFIYSLAEHLEVMDMWVERPYLFVFPMIGGMAVVLLAFSVQYRWDEVPFLMVTVIFLCAFGTLALSFWPYMIPFVLTIEESAAPQSSLAFMFWGEGLFVFPLMLFYTAISYSVFRGKVRSAPENY